MKHFVSFTILSFSFIFVVAQEASKPIPSPYYPYPHPFVNEYSLPFDSAAYFKPHLMQPVFGIGAGILTFYGDVRDKNTFSPSLSRLGYNFSVSEYLTRYLTLGARVMFGTVGADEKGSRFANFESTIRSGGIYLSYNFDPFLPKKRRIEPFMLAGLEYFEFLTKTDLFDGSGKEYHLWKDGSIMSLDENDVNAAHAIPLNRDYKYETDVRKWNKELFGKYPEQSIAIPVGAGVNLHLAPRWNFKLGTTLHFSFTDYIDGITEKNKGDGKGNNKNDKFLETYFTLSFDLFNPKPPFISPLTDEEFLALENADSDGDGIIDFNDSCQGTPAGVPVNQYGCPPDSDGDGKPDYADKEVNSPSGAFVNENGIAMDDSIIAQKWQVWSDTANLYTSYTQVTNPVAVAGEGWAGKRKETLVYRRELTVLLNFFKSGVPPEEMEKLLNVPDVKSNLQPDSVTAYTSGTFSLTSDAEKRRDELIAGGFKDAKIMVKNKDGSLSDPSENTLAALKENTVVKPNEIIKSATTAAPINMKDVVYRIQLGAYSKKLSSSLFKNAGEIIELKTADNLYKYLSGSYNSIQDAIQQKGELLKKGYSGAFVVAYKEGKRVPLSGVSGGIIQKSESIDEPKRQASAINKDLISFRIQVGTFSNEPPQDILTKLNKIPGLEKRKKSNGMTQYLAGKFNSYQEAEKFKNEIVTKYGIEGAFMIAYFKTDAITIQEALELLK